MTRPRQRPVLGPGPDRLLLDGTSVAPLQVARTRRERNRGLLGTSGVVGALWIVRCPSVHMIGMRYPIDVAAVDRSGRVLYTRTIRPWWGATWPRWRVSATIEAAAGSMDRWGVVPGSVLEIGPGQQG